MASAQYNIYLCDPFGVRLGDASNFVKLQYTRIVNDVGTLKMWLPSDFDTNLIRIPDGRIEVWRKLPGSSREYLDTETVWLIKALQWDRDDDGNVSLLVEADTLLAIMRDRWDLSSGGCELVTAPTDDQIKQVARHIFTPVDLTANWADFTNDANAAYAGWVLTDYFSIAADLSAGVTFGAWETPNKNILKVMQELAAASAHSGTYIAFDLVCPTPNTIEFRTYAQQRGVDHRFPNGQNPVLFGGALSSVAQASLRLDHRKEVTYGLAQGPAVGYVGAAWDITRIYASPFGRKETIVRTNATDQTVLDALAGGAVRGGRAKSIYRGRLVNSPDARYGVHWGWGDFITVQDFGQSFDCRIEAVTVTVEKNQEKIDAYARSDT